MLTTISCLGAGISHAQTITNSTTLQPNANFNIDGLGMAQRFITSSTTGINGNGHYIMRQGTANRWGLLTSNVETGTLNQGTDFSIAGYNGDTFLGHYFTIMRNNGFIGLNNTTPTARLHVSGTTTVHLAKFTLANIPEAKAALIITNATGADSSFIPNITARGYSPGRPFALSITAEAEDLVPTANEPYSAAIMMDARSKTGSRLYNANLFAINTYGGTMFMIKGNGNVGIGTNNPGTNRLAVEGTIAARRMKVTQTTPWPDYVFEPDYTLRSLPAIEAFIRENKHLPEVPSAKQITAEGQDLGDMNAILLKKVEELTLYLISMQKEITEVKTVNATLVNELNSIKAAVGK